MAQIGAPLRYVPPRLLGGAALVFWGAMVGQPIIGLVGALILEAAAWLPARLNLQQSAYLRAWQLGALLFIATIALQLFLGRHLLEIYRAVIWAPIYFYPVELAQRYGKQDLIPANTFSFFARRKMISDLKEGRDVKPLMMNTGYPFIVLCLLTAAQADNSSWIHFAGLILLILISLISATRSQRRWGALVFLVAAIATVGWGTQMALKHSTEWLQSFAPAPDDRPSMQGNVTSTRIGKLGPVKQSPRIFWRATFGNGRLIPLLRGSSYNIYDRTRWKHTAPIEDDGSARNIREDYLEAVPFGEPPAHIFNYVPGEGQLNLAPLRYVTLRGSVNQRNPTILPTPSNSMAITGLARSLEELNLQLVDGREDVSLESNSLGTVRVENTISNAIEFTTHFGPTNRTEQAPYRIHGLDNIVSELIVPESEIFALEQIIDEAGIRDMSAPQAIEGLKAFFRKKFSYTTHLEIGPRSRFHDASALSRFLMKHRRGHCEYFATATTLILRQLDIPTRYCTGFAVKEKRKGSDTYLLRGTSAHAWSRAYLGGTKTADGWVGGEWVDVDLTPPGWFLSDTSKIPNNPAFLDWFQQRKEDFTIWRSDAKNQRSVIRALFTAISLIVIWVAFRLYQRRRNLFQRRSARVGKPLGLATLEPRIARIIGRRPTGQPLATWAADLLGHDPEVDQLLPTLIRLHQQLRFSPQGLNEQDQATLSEHLAQLTRALKSVSIEKKSQALLTETIDS